MLSPGEPQKQIHIRLRLYTNLLLHRPAYRPGHYLRNYCLFVA